MNTPRVDTHPPLVAGLAAFRGDYRALVCDVWGVVHNGVAAHPAACAALVEWRRQGGLVVLVTNSPRLADGVADQLVDLGAPREAFDAIVTSGEMTRRHILSTGIRRVHTIGPPRDVRMYDGTAITLVGPAEAELVVVTGLVDDEAETPEDYRPLLEGFAARGLTLVSANPDIVVERGERLVWCAGALARLYQDLGGAVVQVGKPFAPIYREALATIARLGGPETTAGVLAVGDGLPTDVRGAVDHGIDCLFVTAGIHGRDFGPPDRPDPALVGARLTSEGLAAVAAIPMLAW